MNRKQECIQLILLIIPYSALILKYFLSTQQTIPQQQVNFLTMHDQFAVNLSSFTKPQSKQFQVNNFPASEIFYCDQLVLTENIQSQLISNDFSIEIAKNNYSFYVVQNNIKTPQLVNCGGNLIYNLNAEESVICKIDNISTLSYAIDYFSYDLSICSEKFTGQNYLVGRPISKRVDISGFKVSVLVFSGKQNQFLILFSMIMFVISLIILVYWSYVQQISKKNNFVYLTDENNDIEIELDY